LTFKPRAAFATPPLALGSVDQAVKKLLRIYRAPPGQLLR
jgi:hypothetical protein